LHDYWGIITSKGYQCLAFSQKLLIDISAILASCSFDRIFVGLRRQKLMRHGFSNFDYNRGIDVGVTRQNKGGRGTRFDHIFIHVSIPIKPRFDLFDLSLTFSKLTTKFASCYVL
jgi:hypothetical protein